MMIKNYANWENLSGFKKNSIFNGEDISGGAMRMNFINEEMYKNNYGIYGIRNKENGNVYVGQTSERFLRRFWHHRWKLRNNCHDNSYLQNSWNKYGEDSFEYFILESVTNKELLNKLEIYYIDIYKKQNKSYNMLLGGGGRRGFRMSDKTKRLIGDKNRENMLGIIIHKRQKKKCLL